MKKIKLGSRFVARVIPRYFYFKYLHVFFIFRAEAKDGINRTALREIKLLQEVKKVNLSLSCMR